MATLRVLNSSGDFATDFTQDAHDEAQRLFEKLRTNHTAFKINGPNVPAVRLDSFDATADEIIMVPKVVGG